MDRYSRQEGYIERKKYEQLRIAIIGCGAIGGNLAEQIIRAGLCKSLYLIDNDNYEIHNANRQKNLECDVGKNKAEALKEYLTKVNSSIEILVIKSKIVNLAQMPEKLDIIFTAVDNYTTRLIIQDYPNAYIIDGGTDENDPNNGTTLAIHPNKEHKYENYVSNIEESRLKESMPQSCSEKVEPAIITTTMITATIMTQRLIDWIEHAKHEPRMSYQSLNGTYKINWFEPN